jgi:hypothetical protein
MRSSFLGFIADSGGAFNDTKSSGDRILKTVESPRKKVTLSYFLY